MTTKWHFSSRFLSITKALLVLFVLLLWVNHAKGQEDVPLPVQVLQATLEELVPPDTPVRTILGVSVLEADKQKDDSDSGLAFSYSEEEPGAWIAKYGVVSTHPTGTGDSNLPLYQSCQNQVQITIINILEVPPEAILTPNEELFNLSIADAAENGFETPELVSEFNQAGFDANQHIGSQSFHEFNLNYVRIPNLEEGFDQDAGYRTRMTAGFITYLVWQQGEWIFLLRDESKFEEYYQVLMPNGEVYGNEYRYQDTCAISRHPKIDPFEWAETLYQQALAYDLEGGGAATDLDSSPEAPAATITPNPNDRDWDGILDDEDMCSNQYGVEELCGCPQGSPAAGDMLFRYAKPAWFSSIAGYASSEGVEYNFGHVGIFAGDLTADRTYQVHHAQGLSVYRPNPNAGEDAIYPGYDFIHLREGEQVQPGDIVPDAVIEGDKSYGGVGISNLDNFKVDHSTTWFNPGQEVAYGYPRTRLSCRQRKEAIDSMLTLAHHTDEGSYEYEMWEQNCADAVSQAYDYAGSNLWREYVQKGQVVTPNFLASWLNVTPISAPRRDFDPNASPEPQDRSISIQVHSPVYLQVTDANGQITGVSADGLMNDIPGSEVWSFDNGAKGINVFGDTGSLKLSIQGNATGSYNLSIFTTNYPQSDSNQYTAYPPQQVTAASRAELVLDPAQTGPEAWTLSVDQDGDGNFESTSLPQIETVAGNQTDSPNLIKDIDLSNLDTPIIVLTVALCGAMAFGTIGLLILVFFLRRKRKAARSPVQFPTVQTPSRSSTGTRTALLTLIVLLLGIACCAGTVYFGQDLINEYLAAGTPKVENPTLEPEEVDAPTAIPELATRQESTLAPAHEPAQPLDNVLSPNGPWIVFNAKDGLWALNSDGSGLTHLVDEIIVAPTDLQAGISPSDGYLAFASTSNANTLQNLTLKLVKLPEGTVETITQLTSPENEPPAEFTNCNPKHEAARAVTVYNGLNWSHDGRRLAFVGAINGPTSDLYLYSREDGRIQQLTDGPSQAYGVHWSSSGRYIIHFGATCFGTGDGFNMAGSWAVRPDDGEVVDLYIPDSESYGEEFVANALGDDAFYVSSLSSCPYRNLRWVDIETRDVTPLYPDCFNDYDVGPTNLLAVLAGEDFSAEPGLYIFEGKVLAGGRPSYIPVNNGSQVEIQHDLAIIEVMDYAQSVSQIRSVRYADGQPGWYTGLGSIPQFSQDGQLYSWLERDTFYLGNRETGQPQILSTLGARHPFWYEVVNDSIAEGHQYLMYFVGDNLANLYLASSPDFTPLLIAENLNPHGEPALMVPTNE